MTTVDPWPATLDCLEEWVRRMSSGLRVLELPEAPPALPEIAVPGAHQVRARALLERLAQTQDEGQRRREKLVREAAYGGA